MIQGAHWVRTGLLGVVGRFRALGGESFPRGTRVVCRTPRGQEIGVVLNGPPRWDDADSCSPIELSETATVTEVVDGVLLRRVTPADDLLLARLERHRETAFRACQGLLKAQGHRAVLVDVEHLFDGESLVFYFLGPVSPKLDQLIAPLAEKYAKKIELQRFATVLEQGCGPGCGTEEGAGCSTSTSGGCASCALSGSCHSTSPAK